MSQQQSVWGETEKKAAERYLWWPVYLVREKRRLAGITEAVRAGSAAAAGQQSLLPTPPVVQGESAEDYLLRAEQQGEAAFPDPMSFFEDKSEDLKTGITEEFLSGPEADFELAEPLENPLEAQQIDTTTPPSEGLKQAFKLPITDDTNSLW